MNYAALQQSVNRLLANIWAWIAFIPAFVSSTAQDVSITMVDTEGNEVDVVHPNIAKWRENIFTKKIKIVGDNNNGITLQDNRIWVKSQAGTENERSLYINQYDDASLTAIGVLDKNGDDVGKDIFINMDNGRWRYGDQNARGELLTDSLSVIEPVMAGGVDGQVYIYRIGQVLMFKIAGVDRNGTSVVCTIPSGFRPVTNTYHNIGGKTVELKGNGDVTVSADGNIWDVITVLGESL